MSKKHKKYFAEIESGTALGATEGEYKIIRRDLVKVVILNVIYLALILSLYYTNQKSHYLERWFESLTLF